MALQGITPVQPSQQQKVSRGGKLGRMLSGLGLVVGGTIGAAGGPMGALKGASAGAAAGGSLGNLIDPVRTKTVTTQGPQSMGQVGQVGGGQSLSQKYKMSDAGRLALEGLQVAKAVPEYREYQEPLAMAILQDISANNRQRIG